MIHYSFTYPTPQENLAFDEYAVQVINTYYKSNLQKNNKKTLNNLPKWHCKGLLRTWESSDYFVVLGRSKKVAIDVNKEACQSNNIPILTRCSGGGTVLQGPGCFNYSFCLPISYHNDLIQINSTTSRILSWVIDALSNDINTLKIQGISDITIGNLKVSGNAQRRLKHAILFHGTILYNFDIDLISTYLKYPLVVPDYRNNRAHSDFITNIPLTSNQILTAIKTICSNTSLEDPIPIPNEILKNYQ